MRKIIGLIILSISINTFIYGQKNHIKGVVKERTEAGVVRALPYANVYWLGTTEGTTTDKNGNFELKVSSQENKSLIVNFVGYKNDTVEVSKNKERLEVILTPTKLNLESVEVTARQSGSYISQLSARKTEVITTAGLQKLACCNLSESFENSATVDVGYTDAVSGAKQIQMLGLAGIYSQIMFENMPFLRGLAAPFGLSYVPGSWMQSIQVSKGTASVINGYESVTGQINIEYKKPEHSDEKLFVNLYGNNEERAEANVVANSKLSESVSTMLMVHGSSQQKIMDHNEDGFIDAPKSRQINVFNRWSIENGTRRHTQLGIGLIDETRTGGQIGAINNEHWLSDSLYKVSANTKRVQAFLKSGIGFDDEGCTSLGFQASGTYHNQESFFGTKTYSGTQKSFYSNLIFQSEIGESEMHKYSLGASYQFDNINEQLADTGFLRTESVPGVFVQYTFDYRQKFSFITGFRTDFNSVYGTFFTPRLHLRYEPLQKLVFRASAGKGYRTASIVADNMGFLASSRKWIFIGTPKPEEAWNFGMNMTKTFELNNTREAIFTLDFYRTSFINQVVTDLDQDVHQVVFYNLAGKSFSNSFQAELTVEPFTRFNITAAFRYNDVKLTLDGELKEKPFVNKHKGLLTLSYSTRFNKWQFDFTTQYNGVSRLPDTEQNPPKYRRAAESSRYFILHSQITRRFKHIDVYAGGENLGGYVQHHPVVGADEPYGKYFDSSMIWGPLTGRMFYAGLRLTLK